LNKKSVEVRSPLWGALECYANEQGMSIEELVDHILRSYVENFDLWDSESGDEEDE